MCFKTLTGGWEESGSVFVGRARSLIDLNILPRPVLKQSKGAFFSVSYVSTMSEMST